MIGGDYKKKNAPRNRINDSAQSVFEKARIDVYFISDLLERQVPLSIIASILDRPINDVVFKKAIQKGYQLFAERIERSLERKRIRGKGISFWRKSVGLIVKPQLWRQSIKFNFVKSVSNTKGKKFETLKEGRGFMLDVIEIIQTLNALDNDGEFKAYHKHPNASDKGVAISIKSESETLRISLNGDKKYFIHLSKHEKELLYLIIREFLHSFVKEMVTGIN